MALVPKDLLEQIAELEKLFTVPTDKLIAITDRFVEELTKGLLFLNAADSRTVERRGTHCMSTVDFTNK